jgi:hypothetical protein
VTCGLISGAYNFGTLTPGGREAAFAPDGRPLREMEHPHLAATWPAATSEAILSDKDKRLPRLADLKSSFVFTGGA